MGRLRAYLVRLPHGFAEYFKKKNQPFLLFYWHSSPPPAFPFHFEGDRPQRNALVWLLSPCGTLGFYVKSPRFAKPVSNIVSVHTYLLG